MAYYYFIINNLSELDVFRGVYFSLKRRLNISVVCLESYITQRIEMSTFHFINRKVVSGCSQVFQWRA